MHQLGKALHREKESGVRSTRRLQDLREVPVPKGRELIEHDAEQWFVGATTMEIAFVPFAHDQLKVLQQHFSESPNRLGVLVHIQGYKQDQLLLDHFVQGE
jgi:hypothetical protein